MTAVRGIAAPIAVPAVMVAAGLAAVVGAYLTFAAVAPRGPGIIGQDLGGYLAGVQRWLDTGSPYSAMQLAGRYDVWQLDVRQTFLYPPPAVAVFWPFLHIPAVLWWAIPLGVLGWFVWRCHPAPWAWFVIAALALWPRTTGAVLLGNSDMWIAAGIAGGFLVGWPVVIVLLKPTMLLFGVIGIRHRSTWVAAGIVAVASLAFLSLWPDWLTAMRNGPGFDPLYSLGNLPLPLVPVVAWVSRRAAPAAPAELRP